MGRSTNPLYRIVAEDPAAGLRALVLVAGWLTVVTSVVPAVAQPLPSYDGPRERIASEDSRE